MFLYCFSSSSVLMLMLVSLRGGPKRSWHQEERRRKGQKMTILTPPPFRVWEQKSCLPTSVKRDQKVFFVATIRTGKDEKTNSPKVVSHISPRYFSTKVSNLCPRRVQLGNRLRFQSPLCHYALWVFPSPLWGGNLSNHPSLLLREASNFPKS